MNKELLQIFTDTTDPEKMEKLMSELFTPSELELIDIRWSLMNDLYKGMPQRAISAKYGISLCKITRGSKVLKNKDSYVRKLLSDKYDDHLHI